MSHAEMITHSLMIGLKMTGFMLNEVLANHNQPSDGPHPPTPT